MAGLVPAIRILSLAIPGLAALARGDPRYAQPSLS
jgi:hypothetical protein